MIADLQAISLSGLVTWVWKREFKLPWREAGPPDHHNDKVDSDQYVVNNELSLWGLGFRVSCVQQGQSHFRGEGFGFSECVGFGIQSWLLSRERVTN